MCRVAVLATGGSTATRTDRSGTAVARASEQELLGDLPLSPGIAVDAEDVFCVGSHATTLEHLQGAAVRVDEHLRDDVVDIVITQGTDTTEETAIFPGLVLADRRLIVLTGAQRPADTPGSDGPRDLADAITVVAHSATRDRSRSSSSTGLCSPLAGPPRVRPSGGRMTGACGRNTVTDAWTPILACARARWEGTDFVNAALRDGGCRVRVTATAG